MFSLGICMYETMSCAMVPPRKQTMFEFEEELKNGNRPNFLENVLKYYQESIKLYYGLLILLHNYIVYVFVGTKVSSSSL